MSIILESIEPTKMDSLKAAQAISQLSTGHLDVTQLPETTRNMISRMLNTIAEGRAFAMFELNSDFTPNQAASFLNVSRPYILKLLNTGKIPYHYVGTHKRIHLSDLMAYKDKQDEDSEKALFELAAQAQELNMGY